MQGILSFILVTILAGVLAAAEGPRNVVRCEILQQKMGRLYFPIGQEAHIYPHARFAVADTTGTDTLVSGYIEHSWDGISVSFPVDSAVASGLTEDSQALIEPAEVDTVSTIIIGTDIPQLRLFSEDSSSDRLEVRAYDHFTALIQDFDAGLLDGCVSFSETNSVSDRTTLTKHPVPYMAALVPNLGRSFNSQGHLTTSLYYRFDHDRASLYFAGQTTPQMCLWSTSDTAVEAAHHLMHARPYPLDPERGRRLIDNLPRPTEKIRLYTGSPDLERLGHYFGDILARDRFAVELTHNKRTADLYLEFIPLSTRVPSTAVYTVQHQLVTDSIAGMAANETLRICAGLAEAMETARSEEDYYQYLDRMSRLQVMDIGVFPLFRPILYFTSYKTLQDVRLDEDGLLDITSAVKVILPPPIEGSP